MIKTPGHLVRLQRHSGFSHKLENVFGEQGQDGNEDEEGARLDYNLEIVVNQ
jgi:hypothetical protein